MEKLQIQNIVEYVANRLNHMKEQELIGNGILARRKFLTEWLIIVVLFRIYTMVNMLRKTLKVGNKGGLGFWEKKIKNR